MANMNKRVAKMKAESAKAAEGVAANAESAKEAVDEAVVAAKETVETVAAVADKAVEATRRTAKKAADGVKAATKKVAKAVDTAKTEVFVQAHGGEASVDELVERAAAAFKAAHKRTAINDLKLYVNADERRAYYVVNGEGGADAYIEF